MRSGHSDELPEPVAGAISSPISDELEAALDAPIGPIWTRASIYASGKVFQLTGHRQSRFVAGDHGLA